MIRIITYVLIYTYAYVDVQLCKNSNIKIDNSILFPNIFDLIGFNNSIIFKLEN